MHFDMNDTTSIVPPLPSVHSGVDTSKRVVASDKRMINAMTDVNQLVPFKYKWAWDMYLAGCANNWMPAETDLKGDAQQWHPETLSVQERLIVGRNYQMLTHANGLGAGTVAMGIYRHLTAPEARQYLLRQGFEEVLMVHVQTYITDHFQPAPVDMPVLAARLAFLAPYNDIMTSSSFKTGSLESDQQFLKAMVVQACIHKGMFGLVDMAQLIMLGNDTTMPGLKTLYRNIVRDVTMHCNFGIEVIEAIKTENPRLWTPMFKEELINLIRVAVGLETNHVAEIAPADVGLFRIFLQVVANRRASQIGLGPIYTNTKNPFPAMGKLLGLRSDDATFETHKVESKTTATLDWD